MHCLKDESGFYLGTTSIGYMKAIIFVIIPVYFLEILNVWTEVIIGILASNALFLSIYPLMLWWVIMHYYILQAVQ